MDIEPISRDIQRQRDMLWMWRRMHRVLVSTQPSYGLSHTYYTPPHTATTKHPSPTFHHYIALLHKMWLKAFTWLSCWYPGGWCVLYSFAGLHCWVLEKLVNFDKTITHITIKHNIWFDNANHQVHTLQLILSFRRQTNNGLLEGDNMWWEMRGTTWCKYIVVTCNCSVGICPVVVGLNLCLLFICSSFSWFKCGPSCLPVVSLPSSTVIHLDCLHSTHSSCCSASSLSIWKGRKEK